MYRYFLPFLFFATLLAAEQQDNNTTVVDEEQLIKVEDTSGLTEDEVRQVAKKIDTKQQKELKNKKQKVRWEDLSPTPIQKDWVQTKSGEWFRGKIKGLYNDKLEFESDEIGLYVFDFDDIKTIKSYLLSV
ncbi:MAG: hypothetical protein FAF04_06975 [Epsilonproteobacteria bacterium]|nr:hypothetical protein [Campylobacterota bacterium]